MTDDKFKNDAAELADELSAEQLELLLDEGRKELEAVVKGSDADSNALGKSAKPASLKAIAEEAKKQFFLMNAINGSKAPGNTENRMASESKSSISDLAPLWGDALVALLKKSQGRLLADSAIKELEARYPGLDDFYRNNFDEFKQLVDERVEIEKPGERGAVFVDKEPPVASLAEGLAQCVCSKALRPNGKARIPKLRPQGVSIRKLSSRMGVFNAPELKKKNSASKPTLDPKQESLNYIEKSRSMWRNSLLDLLRRGGGKCVSKRALKKLEFDYPGITKLFMTDRETFFRILDDPDIKVVEEKDSSSVFYLGDVPEPEIANTKDLDSLMGVDVKFEKKEGLNASTGSEEENDVEEMIEKELAKETGAADDSADDAKQGADENAESNASAPLNEQTSENDASEDVTANADASCATAPETEANARKDAAAESVEQKDSASESEEQKAAVLANERTSVLGGRAPTPTFDYVEQAALCYSRQIERLADYGFLKTAGVDCRGMEVFEGDEPWESDVNFYDSLLKAIESNVNNMFKKYDITPLPDVPTFDSKSMKLLAKCLLSLEKTIAALGRVDKRPAAFPLEVRTRACQAAYGVCSAIECLGGLHGVGAMATYLSEPAGIVIERLFNEHAAESDALEDRAYDAFEEEDYLKLKNECDEILSIIRACD